MEGGAGDTIGIVFGLGTCVIFYILEYVPKHVPKVAKLLVDVVPSVKAWKSIYWKGKTAKL